MRTTDTASSRSASPQRVDQLPAELEAQGVALLGSVQGDPGDPVGDGVDDGFGHRGIVGVPRRAGSWRSERPGFQARRDGGGRSAEVTDATPSPEREEERRGVVDQLGPADRDPTGEPVDEQLVEAADEDRGGDPADAVVGLAVRTVGRPRSPRRRPRPSPPSRPGAGSAPRCRGPRRRGPGRAGGRSSTNVDDASRRPPGPGRRARRRRRPARPTTAPPSSSTTRS